MTDLDPSEPDTTEVGVKIRAHPALCLGYGLCHRFARDVYSLDAEGHIAFHRLDVPPDLAYEAWIGASTCPQRAITVIGEPESHWRERRDAAPSEPSAPSEEIQETRA